MKTNEILKNIRESGGFDNFNNWSKKEVKQWIKATYNCSNYIAQKVTDIIY